MTWLDDHVPFVDGDIGDSTWLGCSCGWNALDDAKEPWQYHLPDSLDAAWAEAEAALPEGWRIDGVDRADVEIDWWEASASGIMGGTVFVTGDTPPAALRALAERLRNAYH